MVALFMNDEFERIWKGVIVAQSRSHHGIFLESLREVKNLLVSIADVSVKIQSEHSPNTSLHLYR
jgi:hypothetical protein